MAVEGKLEQERNGKADGMDAPPDPKDTDAARKAAADADGANGDAAAETAQAGDTDDPDGGDVAAAYERVKAQLAEERAQREAAQAAQREAAESARRYQQEAQQGQMSVRQANLHAIERAIEANAANMEGARAKWAAAMQEGDYEKAGQAQAEIGEYAARKVQLDSGKWQLENMPEPPAQQAPSEAFEAEVSRYTPRTQQWFRAHPDALRDPKTANLARAAHYTAIAAGHTADSDAYFDAIDQTLGYKQAAPAAQPAAAAQPRRPNGAAPPSRNGTPGSHRNLSSLTVRDMTPAMLEAAKTADIAPEEYLKYYREAVEAGEIQPIH